ncbi:XdhC/CoxI family protein [Desulfitobacterium hafniense]|uniref:Xanthine dehydrogenase n=1 Tax=Desulfitobacterium hafniense (strain Y51) TaxID=138119 RepID=Q24Z76_DESHY|nr:XdhC/CoxI family protein [Desulfitobacterium hafniense]BAE82666.1 hypothetical protein DSY0877 [Desulfitobacterium hafniense Y51]
MNVFSRIFTQLNNGNKVVMLTVIDSANREGNKQTEKIFCTEEDLRNPGFSGNLNPETKQIVMQAMHSGEIQVLTASEQNLVVAEPFFPQPNLLILGGGHIAKPLCEFGSKLNFSVTVVDDRLVFANPQRFPDADQVICESFEKCFERLNFNPYTYVVIVTRGHRYDTVCLRAIAGKTWAYAGMIGSRRRVRGVMEQLIAEGISRDVLAKVNTPIGLEIGAVTPEEIAISILGQVISYRRLAKPELGSESDKINWTEFDRDVIQELSLGKEDNKAIVTVISTRGSVPRKAGAKMIVWPDGRILGSIGGGCSEGAVIQTARDIIREGGYRLSTVDMTGSIAEDEGMVCGGTMEVLVESFNNRKDSKRP